MQDPIEIWHSEHVRFGRLLSALEKQMGLFGQGEQPNYELMADVIHYLRHYPDRYHHPREDVAFARLLRRDPTLHPQIARLRQEHRVIAAAGAHLLAVLEDVVNGAIIARESVGSGGGHYLSYYRAHVRYCNRGSTAAPRRPACCRRWFRLVPQRDLLAAPCSAYPAIRRRTTRSAPRALPPPPPPSLPP